MWGDLLLDRIKVECNKVHFTNGICLIIIALFMPYILKESSFNIYGSLKHSINLNDSGYLLNTAFKLAILNSIRALPSYLGVLIISESLNIEYNNKSIIWTKGVLSYIIIYLIYLLINKIHYIFLDFGLPAIMLIICITFLEKLNLNYINLGKKSFFIILFLIGVQWLDLIPSLSKFGFGRGEISTEIKIVSAFLNCEELLSFFCISFFIIFMFNAILIIRLLYDEQFQKKTVETNRIIEKKLTQSKIQELELRSLRETQNLVHDLKTPLTTIQGLSSLTTMLVDDSKIIEYQNKITSSVDLMNSMISEILYEDKKTVVEIRKLFDILLADLSPNKYSNIINYKINCPDKKIKVNKIRMIRAIINTIENSSKALDKDIGVIDIEVYNKNKKIYIKVKDNGKGIKKENINNIFDVGYSLDNSTGLGLSFIKNVVENNDGIIKIESVENEFTCVTITLDEVD